MLENQNEDLVCHITEKMSVKESSTRLKFIALDKTIFEIEVTSNMTGEMPQQLLDVISTSVTAATKVVVSVK